MADVIFLVRRVAHGPLWVKAAPAILVFVFGLSERSAAFIVTPLVVAFIWVTIKHGLAEQFWISVREQYRRHWDDLVWDHAMWLNHRGRRLETPDEGVDRLAGPWREKAHAQRVATAPRGEFRALVGEAREHARRAQRRELTPAAARAPHELAIR